MTHQNFKVRVYQRRFGGKLQWRTIGLGESNVMLDGRSDVKLTRKLGETLAKVITKLPTGELSRFQVIPGAFLRQTYVDVGMRLRTGKTRLVGEVPLLCQPRQTTADHRALVVCHPLHQEHWFVCADDAELPVMASRFFRHGFGHLLEHSVVGLKNTGKEMLRTVSFSAEVPTLLDRMPKSPGQRRGGRQAQPVLSRIGSDQTLRAIEKTLPVGMPRPQVRELLSLLLGGKRRQSVLVVGEPGVGKSTAINRWIADELEHSGYNLHRDLNRVDSVWRISGKRIIAGMSYLGDWEQRCLDLLAECKKKRAILWVDDIHAFGRLGQTRDSDRNLAEMFRGALARGELTMIGECTQSQRQRLEDDAPSFVSLFRDVRMPATTSGETTMMMMAEVRRLENEHRVRFDPTIYQSVLELAAGLYPWTAFPGKALDLLRRLARSGPGEVTPSDLIRLLSDDTGLPGNLLTLDEPIDLPALREGMEGAVMGQPAATSAALDLVARVRSGLSPSGRPLAVYLFTGPTGTGKTELAKVTARYLYGDSSRLLRFDMSEYATSDAPARLIGDAYQPEGLLTRKIREQPFSIVLLDEIEKAHRSVLYLLLQLFDEGRLTDAAGNTASFANAVIVMTSNLGAKPTRPIGFGSETRGMMADISRAVRDFFPPELFNRIDSVVPFRPLSPEAAEAIATKEMAELFGRRGLTSRNIFVYASRSVKRRIVREAFDPRLGARTVKRYLEHEIAGLLVDEIATAGPARLRVLRIYEAKSGSLAVHAEALGEASPEDAEFPLAEAFDLTPKRLAPLAEEAADLLERELGRASLNSTLASAESSSSWAELAYFADELRDQVKALGKQLASHGPTTSSARAARIRSISTVAHLAANIASFPYPEAHAAWIDLSAVGQGRPAEARSKLIGWLAAAYASARDGWFDGFAVAIAPGKVVSGTSLEELEKALVGGASRVTLLLSGLFALDAFRGEAGAHIWQPPSAEPEIVRVDVTSAGAGETDAAARLAATAAAIRQFEDALAKGTTPLPPNPQGLVPAVRSLRFGLPLRSTDVFPVSVLDFRSQSSLSVNVGSVKDVVWAMLDSWCGRRRKR